MTPPAVLIPVKAEGLKSRLSALLARSQRHEFAELMLMDVLDAFSKAKLISSCFVITSSRKTMVLAERLGANAVEEPADRGVNAAVSAGLRAADASEILVVPADLPLLTAPEVSHAVELGKSWADVVLAPSTDFDGTNLLSFSKTRPVPLSFDQDSFWSHLASSAARGRRVAVYSGRGFRFDIDTPSHFRALARVGKGGRAAEFAKATSA